MSRRLDSPNAYGGTTDHSEEILALRVQAVFTSNPDKFGGLTLAADLLEAHDQTGISLDTWLSARTFVERHIDAPIIESGI